jgi:DNA adenine methylase
MQYLGGKSRIAKQLCAAINPARAGRTCWDAFCGGLSVSAELAKGGDVISTDSNLALISLYQAVVAGWDPPSVVTEEEYQAAKALPDTDPQKAFIGFGCAFGGKWFGGYARPSKTHSTVYANSARNSLIADCSVLKTFECLDFLDVHPNDGVVANDPTEICLYLDPPYAGTESYAAVGGFDHALFWDRAIEWAKWTDVFVSEYACPLALVPVLEFSNDLSLAKGQTKDTRTERLYHLSPSTPLGQLASTAPLRLVASGNPATLK